MTTIASLRRLMLGSISAAGMVLVCALSAPFAAAQMTPMMPNAARVGLYAVDAQTGDLLTVDAALDSAGVPSVDRSPAVSDFAIDVQNGDLVGAPVHVPVPEPGTDRRNDVENTLVDAAGGDLLAAAASAQDSGGAVDRSSDVAATSVDAQNGELLAAAGASDLQAGNDYPFMVRSTNVDAHNGALIAGPPRFIVPEAAGAIGIAASVLLLGSLRIRRSLRTRR